MEQSADIVSGSVRTRRGDARTQALAARRAIRGPSPERYQTPVWLERSFVLPVRDGAPRLAHAPIPERIGLDDLPDQPTPRHEQLLTPRPAPKPLSEFVRPPSPEIDFAAVVRRADTVRLARALVLIATCLGLVAGVVWALTSSEVALPLALGCALAGGLAGVQAIRLSRAPLPVTTWLTSPRQRRGTSSSLEACLPSTTPSCP